MERFIDNYFAAHKSRENFAEELAEHRETQRFVYLKANDLVVMTSDCLEVQEKVHSHLIKDTDENGSGLYLKAKGEILPLRSFALYSLDNMLGVKGQFLTWMSVKDHAAMLNEYAIPNVPKSKKLALFVEDEKVSAVLGVPSFSEIPAVDVHRTVAEYIAEEFPSAEYGGGSFSHEYVEEVWNLSYYAESFDAVLEGRRMEPSFSICTSDCGASSVTIRPFLKEGPIMMPADPLRIQHRGKNGIEEVREALQKVYAVIEKGCATVQELSETVIFHPITTLKRVMKANKIPKLAGLNAIERFETMNGDAACSALDIYQCVCETLMYVPADATMEQKFRYTDDVARVAGVNWKKFDLPGEYNW